MNLPSQQLTTALSSRRLNPGVQGRLTARNGHSRGLSHGSQRCPWRTSIFWRTVQSNCLL